jgi:DDE family transposase
VETIAQVARAMQQVLTTVADGAGRRSGFIQRERKLRGSTFVQALVFGWLANPDATAEERAQAAAARGVAISAHGLDKRCTEQAADCLHQVLAAAVEQVVAADPVAVPLLRRFSAVELYDGSVVALPQALAQEWPGCGGSGAASGAALKLGVRLDLVSGRLHGPVLGAGRDHDRTLPLAARALPVGGLRLADLGFFDLALFGDLAAQGGYWLSRLQVNTAVCDPDGARLDLPALLRAADRLDCPVRLGAAARLPARLLAVRVPQEVADERRRKLHDAARKRGQAVSRARLALADWTILVTNVPAALLSLDEALVLLRARWQIEKLFDLWKTHGHLARTRSGKPWRILCEVYAKLLALLVQHWVLLTGSWAHPDRSLVKAARTVRQHALALAAALDDPAHLARALAAVARCLAAGCRVAKRRQHPGTAQQLLARPTAGAPAMP